MFGLNRRIMRDYKSNDSATIKTQHTPLRKTSERRIRLLSIDISR